MACGANPSRAPNETQHQPMIERLFQPFRDPNLPPEHPAQPHSKYPDRGHSNLALGSVAEPQTRLMKA